MFISVCTDLWMFSVLFFFFLIQVWHSDELNSHVFQRSFELWLTSVAIHRKYCSKQKQIKKKTTQVYVFSLLMGSFICRGLVLDYLSAHCLKYDGLRFLIALPQHQDQNIQNALVFWALYFCVFLSVAARKIELTISNLSSEDQRLSS